MISSIGGTAAKASNASAPKQIIGYYSSWGIYAREFFVTNIAADKLTHINYAFANISDAGECLLGDPWADTQFPYPGDDPNAALLGNFNQLKKLKEQNPNLQTLISIGGWTWSAKFSDVALTEESRARFASSCVDFMLKYGFDGLDIDWEYPAGGGEPNNVVRPEDPANFLLLMADLRAHLDAQGEKDGRHYLLTIAAPAGSSQRDPINWKEAQASLDFINLMAYDFSGAWSSTTGFNAPLFDPAAGTSDAQGSASSAIKAYLDAGVPADKLVLGVPFYGRGWKDVADKNNGLGQPYDGIPAGGTGFFDYRDLKRFWIAALPRYWDDTAKVPWLYDAKSQIMISYDDEESLGLKADYINANNLGGAMIWELASDDQDHTLLNALYNALNK
ncbi:MAG: glycoside hydrolase family 18 protein [Anaerolineae bacterium]|nr:glycoside hydrolase family 18 protein [Anaerolineae bacterium]